MFPSAATVGAVFSILLTTLLMSSGVSFLIASTNVGMDFLHTSKETLIRTCSLQSAHQARAACTGTSANVATFFRIFRISIKSDCCFILLS